MYLIKEYSPVTFGVRQINTYQCGDLKQQLIWRKLFTLLLSQASSSLPNFQTLMRQTHCSPSLKIVIPFALTLLQLLGHFLVANTSKIIQET